MQIWSIQNSVNQVSTLFLYQMPQQKAASNEEKKL